MNVSARMKMPAMTMRPPLVLPPDDRSSARRWILAAGVVVIVHAGIAYWLSRRVEAPNPAGEPEAAVMIELPPVAVSQPAPAAEVPPGPQMKEAAPSLRRPRRRPAAPPPPEPEQSSRSRSPVPELPPEPKADAVLVAPREARARTAEACAKAERGRSKSQRSKAKAEGRAKQKREKENREGTPQRRSRSRSRARARRAPARRRVKAPGRQARTRLRRRGDRPARRRCPPAPGRDSCRRGSMATRDIRRRRRARQGRPRSVFRSTVGTVDFSRPQPEFRLAALDAEAVATVRRSSPFPPPPAERSRRPVQLHQDDQFPP